ncbi:MAG: hypothetical protein ACRC6X_08675 [Culicoidibacterales bacterium]
MSVELKFRTQLCEILNIAISPDIYVKAYDTNYSTNVKIYQKNTPFGTELFVNVDLDRIQIPGLKADYNEAVYNYIRKNIRVTFDYDQGNIKYLVALRNYRR